MQFNIAYIYIYIHPCKYFPYHFAILTLQMIFFY